MSTDRIPITYGEAVDKLVDWQVDADEVAGDLEVYAFPDPFGQTVRIVDISETFPESGDFTPLHFGRSRELPFKSSLMLITPREWNKLQRGELTLPEGWDFKKAQKVWP